MAETTFTNEQFRQIYPDGIEYHYWNHARNAIILRFLTDYGLKDEQILEIGGGRGVVIKYLHEKGISCEGVELAPIEPLKGTEEYFFTGTNAFEMPENSRRQFTVILLLDVIEHIEYPTDFFNEIINSFPNARHFVVTVPARQELWTNYDEFNGHFRRYALEDLKALSSEKISFAGGSYFNHVLYPVFLLYARLMRQRDIVIKAPKGLMIAVHRVLSSILQLDYLLLPRNWRGTSCIGLFSCEDLTEYEGPVRVGYGWRI